MALFNIEAHLHRLVHGSSSKRETVWIRRYARIENAMRRSTEFLMIEGEVGDVIEFVLVINAYQVGTIQYKATGKISIVWNDDAARKARNKTLLARD